MELQLKVIEFLSRYGMKKRFFATNVIGISPDQMSRWLAGKYELTSHQIKNIEEFITQRSQQ